MNFRINAFFKGVSEKTQTDESVGEIAQINLKMLWAQGID